MHTPAPPLEGLRVVLPAANTAYTSARNTVFHARRITYAATPDAGLIVFVSDNQGHTMTVLPEDQHRWPHPGLWFDELAADIVGKQSKAVA